MKVLPRRSRPPSFGLDQCEVSDIPPQYSLHDWMQGSIDESLLESQDILHHLTVRFCPFVTVDIVPAKPPQARPKGPLHRGQLLARHKVWQTGHSIPLEVQQNPADVSIMRIQFQLHASSLPSAKRRLLPHYVDDEDCLTKEVPTGNGGLESQANPLVVTTQAGLQIERGYRLATRGVAYRGFDTLPCSRLSSPHTRTASRCPAVAGTAESSRGRDGTGSLLHRVRDSARSRRWRLAHRCMESPPCTISPLRYCSEKGGAPQSP